MARLDPVGIRLITRRGNDWTQRYHLVVEAVNHLKVRSCLSIEVRKATLASNAFDLLDVPARLQDGSGRDRLKAAGFALPVGAFPRLAEVQESVSTGGEA